MKLGGGKDFPYDANLEGITAEEHERWNTYIHMKMYISEEKLQKPL